MTLTIGFRVFTQIRRPERHAIDLLAGLSSCDISDVLNRACTMVGIKPIYTPIRSICGPAVTVSIPAGGLNMIKMGMQQTQAGDLLVVSAQGDCTYAMWGGNLSRGLKSRGVVGLVMDAAARDVQQIREEDFPVFARGIATAAGVVDAPRGEVNVPIACGGVVVNPGDIVVADEDGIVVVPPDVVAEVAAKTKELMAQHEGLQEILLRGDVTQIDNITKTLVAAGLPIIDSTADGRIAG